MSTGVDRKELASLIEAYHMSATMLILCWKGGHIWISASKNHHLIKFPVTYSSSLRFTHLLHKPDMQVNWEYDGIATLYLCRDQETDVGILLCLEYFCVFQSISSMYS